MSTEEQLQGLRELYQGEVIGEAVFDKMLPHLDDARQRYVVGTMLQLETETKARLRQVAAQRSMDFAEDPAERDAGEKLADSLRDSTWEEKMRTLHDVLEGTYVPRYRAIAAAAGEEDRDITAYMVQHEESLLEVAKRELSGDQANSVAKVIPQLRYPLPPL